MPLITVGYPNTLEYVVTCTTLPMRDAATAIEVHATPNTMPEKQQDHRGLLHRTWRCILVTFVTRKLVNGFKFALCNMMYACVLMM